MEDKQRGKEGEKEDEGMEEKGKIGGGGGEKEMEREGGGYSPVNKGP